MPLSAQLSGDRAPIRADGDLNVPLSYVWRKKARGMLADKQGISSIAEELECTPEMIQELADAKPKPVSLRLVCPRRFPAHARA